MKQKALSLGVPEGPLFRKLQEGHAVKVNGKTIKPEEVLDSSKKRIGKKFSYICDTVPWENYFKAIQDSDLLVHESVFLEKMKSRAKETFHSTTKQAAMVAKKTNAKKLLLIHLSPRHKNLEQFENEARMVFPNSVVAKDLMKVEV
jgi:ribonuclease Z